MILQSVAVRSATEFESAFLAIVQDRADAVLVLTTPLRSPADRRCPEAVIRARSLGRFVRRVRGATKLTLFAIKAVSSLEAIARPRATCQPTRPRNASGCRCC